ncbi:MAG: hypothetical protein Tsb009_27120 [Planctomycetaceae bacterium]
MNNQQTPIMWSFSCGYWARTHVRVSWFLPILLVVICFRLGDLALGLMVGGIFLLSVLLHEFGHIVAVRRTGGSGDEILLWPLGGLASVSPASSFRSRFLTPAAGPIVNATICMVTLIPALGASESAVLFYPFTVPLSGLSDQLLQDIIVLTFWVNWILFLVNLIPVFPFDGGRMLQACLTTGWSGEAANGIYLKVGAIVGLLGLLGGLMADHTWIVALAAFVLILNLLEYFQMKMGESYDESFMGYDFSQGYTSLERDEQTPREKRPGWWERRKQRKQAERERLAKERDAEVQRQLDELLEKIQLNGIESLSESERQQLDRASQLYREKGNLPE